LHEPKGVDSATTKKVYVADGAGSGSWVKLGPQSLSNLSTNGSAGQFVSVDGSGNFSLTTGAHGQTDFYNLTTPYSLTYPSVFTKLAPTTIAGGNPEAITEGTNARLTYTGPDTIALNILYNVSLDQTTGSSRDVVLAVYKNGSVVNAHSVATTTSGEKHVLSGLTTVTAATNDYFEVYALNAGASGNIRVYSFLLNAIFAGS
jgi:hypothetical protein